MTTIDNSIHDYNYTELQDLQQAQIAALRSFYCDEEPLPEVDIEWLFDEERSEIVVTHENLAELCDWLRTAKAWLGFKFTVVEDERGLILVY